MECGTILVVGLTLIAMGRRMTARACAGTDRGARAPHPTRLMPAGPGVSSRHRREAPPDMPQVSRHDDFRRAVSEHVGVPPEHITLFWKGRVALYAILRALGIGRGDEVIVPAFTCVAVPNAVLYTGAVPVYADIDEATYTLDPASVAAAMSPRTRAVLAQNTFGLSSDIEALSALAAPRGAVVIDDCTHGLGGAYRGQPNGAAADAAFYSTQWSKPISTGLGGIAVARDAALARSCARSSARPRSPPPSIRPCSGRWCWLASGSPRHGP